MGYAPGHATDGHVAHDRLWSVQASTLQMRMLLKARQCGGAVSFRAENRSFLVGAPYEATGAQGRQCRALAHATKRISYRILDSRTFSFFWFLLFFVCVVWLAMRSGKGGNMWYGLLSPMDAFVQRTTVLRAVLIRYPINSDSRQACSGRVTDSGSNTSITR